MPGPWDQEYRAPAATWGSGGACQPPEPCKASSAPHAWSLHLPERFRGFLLNFPFLKNYLVMCLLRPEMHHGSLRTLGQGRGGGGHRTGPEGCDHSRMSQEGNSRLHICRRPPRTGLAPALSGCQRLTRWAPEPDAQDGPSHKNYLLDSGSLACGFFEQSTKFFLT